MRRRPAQAPTTTVTSATVRKVVAHVGVVIVSRVDVRDAGRVAPALNVKGQLYEDTRRCRAGDHPVSCLDERLSPVAGAQRTRTRPLLVRRLAVILSRSADVGLPRGKCKVTGVIFFVFAMELPVHEARIVHALRIGRERRGSGADDAVDGQGGGLVPRQGRRPGAGVGTQPHRGVSARSADDAVARSCPHVVTHQSSSLTKPNSNCDAVGQLMVAASELTKDVDVRHTLLAEAASCPYGRSRLHNMSKSPRHRARAQGSERAVP